MLANKDNVTVGTILRHRDVGQSEHDFWYVGREIEITDIDPMQLNEYGYKDTKRDFTSRFNVAGIGDFVIILDQQLSAAIEEYRQIKDQLWILGSRKATLEEFFIESAIKGVAK